MIFKEIESFLTEFQLMKLYSHEWKAWQNSVFIFLSYS